MKVIEFQSDDCQTLAYKEEILDAIKEAKSFVAVTFDKDRILHYHPFNVRHDQAVFAMEYAKQLIWDGIFGEYDEDN